MLAAAEANRLSVINSIKLTMDGQHVVTASLCGPPQVRNVMVYVAYFTGYITLHGSDLVYTNYNIK